jgi:bifunctional DNA-binding transcriptional regulator/antitoxin component of YhaV-PrlF toxin-antitoxin module
MVRTSFEVCVDSKGRFEVPRANRKWFNAPVEIVEVEGEGVQYTLKRTGGSGNVLDQRGRFIIPTMAGKKLVLKEIGDEIKVTEKLSRYV